MGGLKAFLEYGDDRLASALLLAAVAGAGWVISNAISQHNERRRQQVLWRLEFTAAQLHELYGPLTFLMAEGRQSFADLLNRLGRNHVFRGDAELPTHELATWRFWAEEDFMPRNQEIRALLAKGAHLIEGSVLPDSYVRFLEHHSSWDVAHRRWLKDSTPYSWHSAVNWPVEFERDVFATFKTLKERHTGLLGQLAPRREP